MNHDGCEFAWDILLLLNEFFYFAKELLEFLKQENSHVYISTCNILAT